MTASEIQHMLALLEDICNAAGSIASSLQYFADRQRKHEEQHANAQKWEEEAAAFQKEELRENTNGI